MKLPIPGTEDDSPGSRQERPRQAPDPEGPEEIASKVGHGQQEGLLASLPGVGSLSPGRRAIAAFVVGAELVLMGVGSFTDAAPSWLITAGVVILGLLIPGGKKGEKPSADGDGVQ